MTRDLVLLHGWGFTRRVWEPVMPALEAVFRLHNLDLPGYGDRPLAAGAGEPGRALLDRWSDDLAADAPEGALWMGWSLGAVIVLNVMRRAGQAVEAAVLVAATPKFVRDDHWEAGMAPEVFDEFVGGIRADAGRVLRRFLTLQAGSGEQPRAVSRAMSGALVDGDAGAPALGAGLRVLQEADLREGLDRITARALVVHGSADRIVPLDAGAYLARHLPRAELATLDAGHAPFATRPRAFTEAVLAWT